MTVDSLTHDLIVIGAGPAGMTAALTASGLGLKTVLLDENECEGGQIYRNFAACDKRVAEILGPDYLRGKSLVESLRQSEIDHQRQTLVWDIAPDLTVTALKLGRSQQFRARQIIAATGAMERPSPIPGWTLPGVMNVGAAQIALKSAGAVPRGRVVLAGGGPLLLLVACQLLEAGADVVAVVETSARGNRLSALPHLLPALATPSYLLKGLRMLARLRKAAIDRYTGAERLEVHGQSRAQALAFESRGQRFCIEADCVLLHHGVIPDTQVSRMLRLAHRWDYRQLAWHVQTDEWGQTSLPGFRMAGDGVSISGALAAQASGALAALGAARDLERLSREDLHKRARVPRRQLARELRVRPFLDELYRPPAPIVCPSDDTVVCRCEEVTAGRIREMARLGCLGPNQTKFFSRCGMGPCQGRMCGTVVTQILAQELATTPDAVGAYRIRSPLKPIPLKALLTLAESQPGSDGAILENKIASKT